MPELLYHLGVPALLSLILYWAEWFNNRAARVEHEVVFKKATIRYLEAIEAGLVRIVGKVVSLDDGPVNLGSSIERADSISGSPTLEAESFLIETPDGRRFRTRAGAKLKIDELPGAERKLIRTITTETGVEQTYSFEVHDGFDIMITGAVTDPEAGAFREGALDLAPVDSTYRLADELHDPSEAPVKPKHDDAKDVWLITTIAMALAVAAGFVPFLGVAIWWAMMAIAAFVTFIFVTVPVTHTEFGDADAARLEELTARVRVPEPERDEVFEHESDAESESPLEAEA